MRDYIITIFGAFSFVVINAKPLKGVVTKKVTENLM